MARILVSTSRFRRRYQELDDPDRRRVDDALLRLGEYLAGGHASAGLGLKKLASGIFEARAGLALRIVYVEEGARIIPALLGNHDEVRRFLRRQ